MIAKYPTIEEGRKPLVSVYENLCLVMPVSLRKRCSEELILEGKVDNEDRTMY